jgi:integrase/recombinase XerD
MSALFVRWAPYGDAFTVATGNRDKRFGPATVLEEEDIRAILAMFSRRTPSAIRNRALVLLLWRTGLRITEAVSLELRDLQLQRVSPTLIVRNGKFGKQRVVGIHQEALVALERWLEQRPGLGVGRCRFVFCTFSSNNQGRSISPAYVREMLKKKAEKAGVTGRVHPHAFRATLAVELAREGVPLPAIRDVLGHANIAGTDAYLRRVFPQQAVTAVIDRPLPRDPDADRKQLAADRGRLAAAIDELDADRIRALLDALR